MTLMALLIPITVMAARPMPVPVEIRDEPVVTVAWLAQHINDPNLVLLHVGDRAEYDAGHIQGARYLTLDDIAKPHDHTNASALALEMPAVADLRTALERLGISDDSRIVVYYGKDWVSPATRVIFTLDHFGLGERTSLLDGGMGAWKSAGHALSTAVPAPRPTRLTRLAPRNNIVDVAFVESHAGKAGFAVVDGRAAAFYDGVQAGTGGKKGHVPGALSIPFTEITNDQLLIKDRAELERIFRAAGVKAGDVVVGYCHIGQQATAMLFAARLLGHDVRLYDGSFQDWSLRNKPITTERR